MIVKQELVTGAQLIAILQLVHSPENCASLVQHERHVTIKTVTVVPVTNSLRRMSAQNGDRYNLTLEIQSWRRKRGSDEEELPKEHLDKVIKIFDS